MPQFGYQVLGFGGGGGVPPTVWKVHKFTGADTFVVGASGGGDVEILAVGGAGGGGTGTGTGYMGGGGGNGGMMDSSGNGFVASPTLPLTTNIVLGWAAHTVTNGYTYDITIAAGQARDQNSGQGGQTKITSDDSGSEVYLVSFSGGGLGGGGAGARNTTGVQGYRGGSGGGYSGGGNYGNGGDASGFTANYSWGGAGAAGRNAEYGGGGGGPRAHASASVSTQSGTPGAGITNTFLDGSTSVTYGQGGHGGTSTNHSTADNDGDANSGEGGDGAMRDNNDAGNGGSGIVIIRYPEGTIDASGGTETTFSV